MSKAAGRQFADYARLKSTRPFLEALVSDMGIPITEQIQSVSGGFPELQGRWVHPRVAVNLAQWLSPKFAALVTKWVFEWLSGQASHQTRLPDHVRRYLVNRHKIPGTHFSMLDQMTLRLLAPLEQHGYILPARLVPDIALGRMFSKWLRDNYHNPDGFPSYDHEFLDHRPNVLARLYPNEIMTAFNEQLEEWLQDGRARKCTGSVLQGARCGCAYSSEQDAGSPASLLTPTLSREILPTVNRCVTRLSGCTLNTTA